LLCPIPRSLRRHDAATEHRLGAEPEALGLRW
jgi:hypothetical protein